MLVKKKLKLREHEELPPIPFGGDELDKYIRFKCKECGF